MRDTSKPYKLSLLIIFVEIVGILVNTVAIAVAARSSSGATVTATGPEIAVYLGFAVLMVWLAWGIWRRSPLARTPFLVTQLFGIIIGYTAWAGDGTWVKLTGVVILLISAAGLVVSFMPSFVRELNPVTEATETPSRSDQKSGH